MEYGITLDPGETIVRVIKQSIVALLPSILIAIVLALVAAALSFEFGRAPANLPFPPLVVLALVIVIGALAVLILVIGVYVYNHNLLIFTNKHLIEVEQVGLFGRTVSQVSFERVQDVTGRRIGVFGTILNYGDVEIQSAGEEEKFIFHYAPDPVGVADAALQQHEQCMRDLAAAGTPAAPDAD